MYRIGDFSLISRVSIKMLRHYDELGLLKPAHIDRFTNYRYYTLDQLPRLNRLMALKEMGFSLAEVGVMLNESLSAEEIQRLADQRRHEMEQELTDLQQRLDRLRVWRTRIALEAKMPDYEIVLKPYIPPEEKLPEPQAHPIQLPFPGKAGLPEDVVISREVLAVPEVMACVVHHGSEAELVLAYRALDGWMKANGYTPAEPPRELYWQENPDEGITEIQLPVKKITSSG